MSVLFFCEISVKKSKWTDGFLKDINRFFLPKTEKESKCTLLPKKTTRKLFGDFEVGVLFRGILNLARPSW